MPQSYIYSVKAFRCLTKFYVTSHETRKTSFNQLVDTYNACDISHNAIQNTHAKYPVAQETEDTQDQL
jgi:hypothetical protein